MIFLSFSLGPYREPYHQICQNYQVAYRQAYRMGSNRDQRVYREPFADSSCQEIYQNLLKQTVSPMETGDRFRVCQAHQGIRGRGGDWHSLLMVG